MCRFPGATFILFAIIYNNINDRGYHDSESFFLVGNLYVDTKNTSLRYLETKLLHVKLQWRPFFYFAL